MKVAIASQPIDKILLPFQNSVGSCTYGAACALAKFCDVVVYGLQDEDLIAREVSHRGVRFRLLPSTRADQIVYKLYTNGVQICQTAPSISTFPWLSRNYSRQVARELQKQPCDVILLQHCAQYAPVIEALNPGAKIALHLHTPWLSQSKTELPLKRLRAIDLVTTVSEFVKSKLTQRFPMFTDRCDAMYKGIDVDEFRREKDYRGARRKRRILFVGAFHHTPEFMFCSMPSNGSRAAILTFV
jgi:glycosyltransferase involved in cell wall biosynthesis